MAWHRASTEWEEAEVETEVEVEAQVEVLAIFKLHVLYARPLAIMLLHVHKNWEVNSVLCAERKDIFTQYVLSIQTK